MPEENNIATHYPDETKTKTRFQPKADAHEREPIAGSGAMLETIGDTAKFIGL